MNDLEAAIRAVKDAPRDGSVLVSKPTGYSKWHHPSCEHVQTALALGELHLSGHSAGRPFRWKLETLGHLLKTGETVLCTYCPDSEKAPSELAQRAARNVRAAVKAAGQPVDLDTIRQGTWPRHWDLPAALDEAVRKGLIREQRRWTVTT